MVILSVGDVGSELKTKRRSRNPIICCTISGAYHYTLDCQVRRGRRACPRGYVSGRTDWPIGIRSVYDLELIYAYIRIYAYI